MAERPNARLLKSLGMQVPGGSNPSPSAVFRRGSPSSPLIGNVFMHYVFDQWMGREFAACPLHCDTVPCVKPIFAGAG